MGAHQNVVHQLLSFRSLNSPEKKWSKIQPVRLTMPAINGYAFRPPQI